MAMSVKKPEVMQKLWGIGEWKNTELTALRT